MKSSISRRTFAGQIGKGVVGASLISNVPLACAMKANNNVKKLGVALVGLGSYSTYQLAPALQDTEHCYLAAVVTGTPEKATQWSKKYNLPKTHIFNYQNF